MNKLIIPSLTERQNQQLKGIPEEARKDFANHLFESAFWDLVGDNEVPLHLLKERKGAWNKETQSNVMLEYFPEEYTLTELDRLFPGWWTEDMKCTLHNELRTITVEGYLCVEYPTLQGKKFTKRWAIGASRIEYTKDTNPVTNNKDASQPDDKFKAARTEWIKLAGKHYKIGIEIYHQRITDSMKLELKNRVKEWGVHAEEIISIAQTLTKGKSFRELLKSIPTLEQTNRIVEALKLIPDGMKNTKGNDIKFVIWSNFVKLKNNSPSNIKQTEEFITKIEATAQNINNKSKE